MMETEEQQCWICLDEADDKRPLFSPCKCPRKVHPQCLARWQLQQAGRHEEKFCRFCNTTLIDWKSSLTPEELKPEVNKVQPIMVVYFEGEIHRIPVKQGPEGLVEFQNKIRTLFKLPEDVDISLTFGCKEPMSGTHLKLEGTGAFDAAVHCASVAAAERQQRIKKSYSTSNLASRSRPTAVTDLAPHHSHSNSGAAPASQPAAPSTTPAPTTTNALPPTSHRRRIADDPEIRNRSRTFSVSSTSRSMAAGNIEQSSGQSTGLRNFITALRPQRDSSSGAADAGSVRTVSSDTVADQAPAPQPARQPAASRSSTSPTSSASGRSGTPALPRVTDDEDLVTPSRRTLSEVQQSPTRRSQVQHNGGSRSQLTSPREVGPARDSVSSLAEQYSAMPAFGDTVAVGTFSGKLKFHLKAFSKRVARSLSFTNKGQQPSPRSAREQAGDSAGPSSPVTSRVASSANLGGQL